MLCVSVSYVCQQICRLGVSFNITANLIYMSYLLDIMIELDWPEEQIPPY